MIHSEELPYSYRGFHEGEYLHRYFLPESLRSEISPRDLLVVYCMIRGLTPRTHPRLSRPAAFRDVLSVQQANDGSSALLGSSLTINYSQEHLSRVINVEQVTEMVAACQSYVLAIADAALNEAETNLLIDLNDRLRSLQHDVIHRVFSLNAPILEACNSCDLKVRYSFDLRDDDPEYRELDDNSVFSFTDRHLTLEAGIEEMQKRDVNDWNNKQHVGNRLYQTSHCWLFNRLEDFSAVPLRHLLKVGRVVADVVPCFSTKHSM